MTNYRSSFVGLFLCLTLSIPLFGQGRPKQQASTSCRKVVEQFYSWYVDEASKHTMSYRMSSSALKYRGYLFSSDIVHQIMEDTNAQEKAGSDIVSLEGDPFVGNDGFGERYIVERILIQGGVCWAEVHAVWDGKEDESTDVTAELVAKGGRWIFVNFYYPKSSSPDSFNLLGELKTLREARKAESPNAQKK